MRARPAFPTHWEASFVSPSDCRNLDVAAKTDDVAEPQRREKVEQLRIAEAAIRQDRDGDALGQTLRQMRKAEVLPIVPSALQFVLQDGEPQERRGASVRRHEIQREG